MVDTYWNRMKPAVEKKGWSIQQLADAIGVSYQALLKVREGGALSSKNNIKAAELLGLNPIWLATGKEASVHNVIVDTYAEEGPRTGYIRLPMFSAGMGTYPQDEAVHHVDVLASYARQHLGVNSLHVCVLTARDGSMTGEIERGDVMFVQPVRGFTSDGIYVLTLGELIRVKRLRLLMAAQAVSIESNDGSSAEEVPFGEVNNILSIRARVVGCWSVKKVE